MTDIPLFGPEREKYNLDRFCRQMVLASLDAFTVSHKEYEAANDYYPVDPRSGGMASLEELHAHVDEIYRATNERVFRKWFMLIAARQIYRYRSWAIKREILSTETFAELEPFEPDVKLLRDLNEHADEYFAGGGKRRKDWFHEQDGGSADASSIVDGRIGNRLHPSNFLKAVLIVRQRIIDLNTDWDGPTKRREKIAQRDEASKRERDIQIENIASSLLWSFQSLPVPKALVEAVAEKEQIQVADLQAQISALRGRYGWLLSDDAELN